MNLSPAWVDWLKIAGLEAIHWSQVGKSNDPDHVIMTYAADHKLVVLTHDLDFGAILAVTHGRKPSVLQLRAADVSPEAIGAFVVIALEQLSAEIGRGALVTIDPKRTRMSLLPLRSIDN